MVNNSQNKEVKVYLHFGTQHIAEDTVRKELAPLPTLGATPQVGKHLTLFISHLSNHTIHPL